MENHWRFSAQARSPPKKLEGRSNLGLGRSQQATVIVPGTTHWQDILTETVCIVRTTSEVEVGMAIIIKELGEERSAPTKLRIRSWKLEQSKTLVKVD